MDSRPFTLALVQMQMDINPEKNLDKAEHMVREASCMGADVVCLPELFRTRYFCHSQNTDCFDLAEPLDGQTVSRLGDVCRETGTFLMAPMFEKRSSAMYHNTVAFLTPDGSCQGIYRKTHIPEEPEYHEKFYFTPGDTGFRGFDTPYGRIAGLICWDQWFPEAARICALSGALALIYPTAIGWDIHEQEEERAEDLDAWITVQRGHAIANNMYVAAVNRVGLEPHDAENSGIQFWGSSFICGPMGEILASASETEEEIILAQIKPDRIKNVRRIWPFFRDRRVHAYQDILKLWSDS